MVQWSNDLYLLITEHAFTIFMNSYIITTIDSFYEDRKRYFQNLVSELWGPINQFP